MYEDFGERLRRLRKAAGLTQSELGAKINKGVTSISKYESGAMMPTMESAVELAFRLNVTLDELFGYENKSSVSTFGLKEEQKEIIACLTGIFRADRKPTGSGLTPEQYEIIGRIIDSFYSKGK